MNCHFCNKNCLQVGDDLHRCLPCKTEFRKHGVTNIYFRLKGKTYFAQFYPTCQQFKFRIMANDHDVKELLTLQFIPQNINPANVAEKIKKYLPFL